MKIHQGIEDLPRFRHAVVTSGFFDGVHKGHQKILKRLGHHAAKTNSETVVITMWPHPKSALHPERPPVQLLNTQEEKMERLAKQPVQHVINIPFTHAFSETSSHDFIKKILVEKVHTKKLVIGYDHRFGKNREGDFTLLKEKAPQYGFEVEEIPKQEIDSLKVGSSIIRDALRQGNVETAAHFLGYPYTFSGKVVKGEKIGRKMGYPTANIAINSPHKLIPKEGVYAATTHLQSTVYGGMLYIGRRPTLNGQARSVEINLFDFKGDLYGKHITLQLIALLREDVRFDTLEKLQRQITADKKASLSLLNKKKLI